MDASCGGKAEIVFMSVVHQGGGNGGTSGGVRKGDTARTLLHTPDRFGHDLRAAGIETRYRPALLYSELPTAKQWSKESLGDLLRGLVLLARCGGWFDRGRFDPAGGLDLRGRRRFLLLCRRRLGIDGGIRWQGSQKGECDDCPKQDTTRPGNRTLFHAVHFDDYGTPRRPAKSLVFVDPLLAARPSRAREPRSGSPAPRQPARAGGRARRRPIGAGPSPR